MALRRTRQWHGFHALLLAVVMAVALINCRPAGVRQRWSRKWGPLVPHKTFPGDCGICHVPDRWDVLRSDFSFDHEEETGYPLEGAHAQAACLRCHNDRGPVRVYVARGCAGCHPDPHTATLGLDCRRCHDQTNWRPAGLVAEHARTRFPLFGAHVATPCENCHPGATAGQFRGAPTECDLCHQADLARATTPDHAANGWTTNCDRCHSPVAWERANIQHDSFPLVGGHAGLDCTRCHTDGTLGPIPSDCYACHATAYQQAAEHAALAFPTACNQCHAITAWLPTTYRHTAFPLTGGHAGLTCARCHTGGALGTIPSTCYSCHATDYQQAPDHAAQSFPHACEQCHSSGAWTPPTYNHNSFPLTGGHAGVNCTQCHTGGTFGVIPSDCYSCHATDYAGAVDHASQSFPHACEQCHSSTAWTPATYNHNAFPLTGGHAGVTCIQCHTSGTFGTISSDCYACHATDYAGAPDHAGRNFPHTCTQCHTTIAWIPSTLDHSSFPLTGGHGGLTCIQCHTSGTFGTVPSDCYACHATDYAGAPDHAGRNFPHTCTQCHTTIAWIPSTFDHSSFALTGGHGGLTCIQCHTSGTFGTIPSNCYSCHSTDYAGAADHTALSFPQTCEQCHTTTAWLPSTFVHQFPLSGSHNVACTQCHASGSTSSFNCLTCHTKTRADDNHSGISGYIYSSEACYSCHPRG